MYSQTHTRTRRAQRRQAQRGVVAIIVGLSIAVLIGFLGLAIDGGHLYVTKTELQNGADACALAASHELTGAPAIAADAFQRADAAGMAVATRHFVGFQGSAIPAGNVAITYSADLAGAWVGSGAAPADARYVRCTIERTGISPWFMQVLGFGDQAVRSLATATLAPSQANCGIPLGICSLGPPPSYGFTRGQWVSGRFDSQGNITGSFNWIDFTPNAGGASELAGLLRGNGVCTLSVPVPVGEPGGLGNAAGRAWNTRFGLYQSTGDNVTTTPPDYTGYAYTDVNWSAQANAYPDFMARRATHDSYGPTVAEGNAITGLSITNAYNPTTTPAQHTQFGADRRVAVAPIINCNEWEASQTVPVRAWACILMLHPISHPSDIVRMEYLGLSTDPDSPCATSGVVGDANSPGPMVPALVQ
jgi:hypothetical protein